MRFGPELGLVATKIGQQVAVFKTRVNLEAQALKLQIAEDKLVLESAVSREDAGFLKHYPTRLGSVLVGATTYFLDRVTSGDPPEKIIRKKREAAKNSVLIKSLLKP